MQDNAAAHLAQLELDNARRAEQQRQRDAQFRTLTRNIEGADPFGRTTAIDRGRGHTPATPASHRHTAVPPKDPRAEILAMYARAVLPDAVHSGRQGPAGVAGGRRQVNIKFKMRNDLQTMTIDFDNDDLSPGLAPDFADDDIHNPY